MNDDIGKVNNINAITTSYNSKRKLTTPNDDCWTPEKIKYELALKGFTLAQLARHHELSESTFRICIRKPWPVAEQLLAQALCTNDRQVTPQLLFPHRYDEQGYPLKYSKHLGNQNAKKRKPK